MGGTPDPPPAPDPAATARAQGAINRETAIEQARLNRINESTPFGDLTYSATGNSEVPYQRTIELSPEGQRLLGAQNRLSIGLADLGGDVLDRVAPDLAQPFTLEGLPPAPVAGEGYRSDVQDAILSRLNPQIDQDREALATRLSNMGFDRSSEGFRREMDRFQQGVNDARQQAVLASGAEASRLFGLDQAARQQGIQEASLARAQPLNEIATLLGTAGAVPTPSFSPAPQVGVAPADIVGPTYAAYNADLNAFNQQQAGRRSTMGGLFGLGGSALSAGLGPGGFLLSDARAKTDIKPFGQSDEGHNIYSYRYKADPTGTTHIGVMAQELERTDPQAVAEVGGVKLVDYGAIGDA